MMGSAPPEAAPMLQHLRCADDDPDMRMILEVALETVGGWRVTMCADGEEALAAARADRPDLMLLDASMPGIDGPSTLALLRADPDLAEVPVVFVTGQAAPEDVEAFLAAGGLAVFTKPVNPMELPARLRAVRDARPRA
ncbi:MAG: response regulator [Lysobacteraceae bacterium]